MARTQDFDSDAVVRAARTVFWGTGFEEASIPRLEEATGLSRSSIYNTFGSKRGLFDAAVQNYLDEVVRPRLEPLTAEPVAPDAIVTYLTGLRAAFETIDSMSAVNGCLLINAAGTPIAKDPHVASVIAEYRAELHGALARGVRAHSPELAEAALAHASDNVTGLVIAAFALARVAPVEAARSLSTALELLD